MAQLISRDFSLVHSPAVLCIGGTESKGLAGLSVDQKTLRALGVHCAIAVTAVTAQANNARKLVAIETDALHAQLQSAMENDIHAIKIGLIANDDQARLVIDWLNKVKTHKPTLFVIYDPVRVSGEQQQLSDMSHSLAVKLAQISDLVTPNREELYWFIGHHKLKDSISCARDFFQAHNTGIVAKGGHWESKGNVCDFVIHGEAQWTMSTPRLGKKNVRGTGCCFAAAIAGAIAIGHSVVDALVMAKMLTSQAIDNASQLGHQRSVNPLHYPNSSIYLPAVSTHLSPTHIQFLRCEKPIDLYPIVDSAQWCEKLFSLGVGCVQLRCKELSNIDLRQELSQAIEIAQKYHAQLFINDHWKLAIELGAYGVHLGQEDLDKADLSAISRAQLRLGISTHCLWEVARATSIRPSYIACGPIFPTSTKTMPWHPQGFEGLRYWRGLIDLPLIAIGGIKSEHLGRLVEDGANGIAMISAITNSHSPEKTVAEMLELIGIAKRQHHAF